jgi:2-amino-4-hydroxy-6-hydroxymethyldihydropteridine diphosphokinase
VRWGPRTLDVDIVAVGDVTSDDPELTLPHPRAHERAFVLVPWLAVDPDASLAGKPVAEWLAALPPTEVAAVRRTEAKALR